MVTFTVCNNSDEIGFIIVQTNIIETSGLSNVFHDICRLNFVEAELPDRIMWYKAIIEKYPCYYISRPGIYGNSTGDRIDHAQMPEKT